MTNWPDEPSPHRTDYSRARQQQEAPRAADIREKQLARLDLLKGQMLDRIEAELDNIAARQKASAEGLATTTRLSIPAARRRLANIVGSHEFCSRAACRRGGSCRGEPKQCLAEAMPLLPPQIVSALTLDKPGRRGRQRR
ncbi:MAG TPA: hypothetical protein VNR39_10135 [Pseudolabrys sp.]|nr:hypothetical protein [Pseudolabrys sp.]